MSRIEKVLRSHLKLRHLQLLVVLDELRHLSRTAEYLRTTQPAALVQTCSSARMTAFA